MVTRLGPDGVQCRLEGPERDRKTCDDIAILSGLDRSTSPVCKSKKAFRFDVHSVAADMIACNDVAPVSD